MEKLECEGLGSNPAPDFKWYVGKNEIEMNNGRMHTEDSSNDNFVTGSFAQEERKEFIGGEEVAITTGSIRFIPKNDDNGKYISCRVTNSYFPEVTKEDGYLITVNCKKLQFSLLMFLYLLVLYHLCCNCINLFIIYMMLYRCTNCHLIVWKKFESKEYIVWSRCLLRMSCQGKPTRLQHHLAAKRKCLLSSLS